LTGPICFEYINKLLESWNSWSNRHWGVVVDGQKDEKKAQLVRIAVETIRKHGIRKTTLEDIADASGMAPPSMYYYFANKKDLLRAAISALLDSAFEEIERAVALSPTPQEKLTATWKVLFREVEHSDFLLNPDRKVRSQIMEIADEFVSNFNARYRALVRKILSEGNKQGVFHVEGLDVTAALLSTGVWSILLNHVNQVRSDITEAWLDEWGKLLMNGLKKR